MKKENIRAEKYKYLWLLITIYAFITISSDLYESKIISIFFLHAGAGILLFSFNFFLIEIIAEVYGYKKARLAIWIGIFFSGVFVAYTTLFAMLSPLSPSDPVDIILAQTKKIYISTILTVFVAENINAYIVSKLKIFFLGKYIGIRFVLSIFVATGISMTIFTTFAFLGRMPFKDFLIFTISSWFYRFITELLLVPFSTKLSKILKNSEKVDIFDFNTNYNVLNLESSYATNTNSNQFKENK